MLDAKKCSKCGLQQPLNQFTNDKSRSDGLFPQCRTCRKHDKHLYYLAHRDHIDSASKTWVKRNPERRRAIQRRYEESHREQTRQQAKQFRKDNPEIVRRWTAAYYAKHKAKLLELQRKGRLANPTKAKARAHAYYLANREAILIKSKERYWSDPGKHNALVHRWHARNPEKRLQYVHARRAKRLNNGGSYTKEEWLALKASYNHTCLCCGLVEPLIRLTVDHVIPIVSGGSNDISNIQPLCRRCNQSKQRKTIDYRMAS